MASSKESGHRQAAWRWRGERRARNYFSSWQEEEDSAAPGGLGLLAGLPAGPASGLPGGLAGLPGERQVSSPSLLFSNLFLFSNYLPLF